MVDQDSDDAARELRMQVSEILSGLEPGDVGQSRQRLEALDVRSLLDRTWTALPSLKHEFASESYRHANGFTRISFPSKAGELARLKLHVWDPPTQSPAEPDAHNHRWSFASRLLLGGIASTYYEAEPSPHGHMMRYEHRVLGRGYAFVAVDRVRLHTVDVVAERADSTYSLHPTPIHRVANLVQSMSATLVIELPPVRHHTDVFVPPDTKAGVVVPTRFSAAELVQAVSAVREALSR